MTTFAALSKTFTSISKNYESIKKDAKGKELLNSNYRNLEIEKKFQAATKTFSELKAKFDSASGSARTAASPAAATPSAKAAAGTKVSLAKIEDQIDLQNFEGDLTILSSGLIDLEFVIPKLIELDKFKDRIEGMKKDWEGTYKTDNEKSYPTMDADIKQVANSIVAIKTDLETRKNFWDQTWQLQYPGEIKKIADSFNPLVERMRTLLMQRTSVSSSKIEKFTSTEKGGDIKRVLDDGVVADLATAVAANTVPKAIPLPVSAAIPIYPGAKIDFDTAATKLSTTASIPELSWSFEGTPYYNSSFINKSITCLISVPNAGWLVSGSSDKVRVHTLQGLHTGNMPAADPYAYTWNVPFYHIPGHLWNMAATYLPSNTSLRQAITALHEDKDIFIGTLTGSIHTIWSSIPFPKKHYKAITYITSDPDNTINRIVSVDEDGIINTWFSSLVSPLPTQSSSGKVVNPLPDDTRSNSQKECVNPSVSWKHETTLISPEKPVTGLAVVDDGYRLLTGLGTSSSFCIWNFIEIYSSDKLSATSGIHYTWIRSAAAPKFTSFQKLLAAGDTRDQDKIITCGEKAIGVWSLPLLLNENKLLTSDLPAENTAGNATGNAVLDATLAYEFSVPTPHTATCFSILSDKNSIVVGSKENFISILFLGGRKFIADIDLNKESIPSVLALKKDKAIAVIEQSNLKAPTAELAKDKTVVITPKNKDAEEQSKKTDEAKNLGEITALIQFPDPDAIEIRDESYSVIKGKQPPKGAKNVLKVNSKIIKEATPKDKKIFPPAVVISFSSGQMWAYKLSNIIAEYEQNIKAMNEALEKESQADPLALSLADLANRNTSPKAAAANIAASNSPTAASAIAAGVTAVITTPSSSTVPNASAAPCITTASSAKTPLSPSGTAAAPPMILTAANSKPALPSTPLTKAPTSATLPSENFPNKLNSGAHLSASVNPPVADPLWAQVLHYKPNSSNNTGSNTVTKPAASRRPPASSNK